MNLNLFGQYTTISFDDRNKDTKLAKKLSNSIFTGTTRFTPYLGEYKFIDFILNGDIKIHKFNYLVPKEPINKVDYVNLNILKKWGKIKSQELEKLYWFCDRTLDKLGFGLIKVNTMYKDFRISNKCDRDFIIKDVNKFVPMDYMTFKNSYREHIFRDDIQVYCGWVDEDRIVDEMKFKGIKYFIIFPFISDIIDLKEGEESIFYLLEGTDEFIEFIHRI